MDEAQLEDRVRQREVVTTATAEKFLKIGPRRRRQLVQLGKLESRGQGLRRGITTKSLLHYKNGPTPSEPVAGQENRN